VLRVHEKIEKLGLKETPLTRHMYARTSLPREYTIDKYCYIPSAYIRALTVVDTQVIALSDAHLLQRLVHQDVQSLRRITMRRP